MNAWDYILIAVIAAALSAAVFFAVRNKKKGKCSCGCDCSCCSANCKKKDK